MTISQSVHYREEFEFVLREHQLGEFYGYLRQQHYALQIMCVEFNLMQGYVKHPDSPQLPLGQLIILLF